MERPSVETKVIEWLGQRADRWSVEASQDPSGHWVVGLDHPASAGLRVETATVDQEEAASMTLRVLEHAEEIDIAAAAPTMAHGDLLAGVRTVAAMFEWTNLEVRAVAFLMFENGHLNHDETAWVSGYIGADAPMRPISPTG